MKKVFVFFFCYFLQTSLANAAASPGYMPTWNKVRDVACEGLLISTYEKGHGVSIQIKRDYHVNGTHYLSIYSEIGFEMWNSLTFDVYVVNHEALLPGLSELDFVNIVATVIQQNNGPSFEELDNCAVKNNLR